METLIVRKNFNEENNENDIGIVLIKKRKKRIKIQTESKGHVTNNSEER